VEQSKPQPLQQMQHRMWPLLVTVASSLAGDGPTAVERRRARGGVLAARLSGARATALEMGRRQWSGGTRAEECRRRARRSAGGGVAQWSSGGGAGALAAARPVGGEGG
jgi:hypothetical protein